MINCAISYVCASSTKNVAARRDLAGRRFFAGRDVQLLQHLADLFWRADVEFMPRYRIDLCAKLLQIL